MQKGSPTYRHLRTKLIGKLWKAYKATTALEFLKELRLALICRKKHIRRKRTLQKMRKLCRRAAQFKVAYQFPQAHRTSNMLDCAPRTGFRQSRAGITKIAYYIRCNIFMVIRSQQNYICVRWH
ncbi:MAG: hypothetical protein QNJ53_29295 [Pleurocapsa sp. MO_192.B19]|nr:hypothetical protein [Pleurocapsa sp. MO_192.B19]